MTTSEFIVTGMTCGHCENAIRTEVSAIAGVTEVEISAQSGKLLVTSTAPIDAEEILAAVDEAGYAAVSA